MLKIIFLLAFICISCIETKVSFSNNTLPTPRDKELSICQNTCVLDQSLDQKNFSDHQGLVNDQSKISNDEMINDLGDMMIIKDLSFIEKCALNEDICNQLDDDCDGMIDENQACGKLLASHCELTVGWTDYPVNGVESIDHWPRNTMAPSSAGCPQEQPSQLINHYLETTCGKTGKDQLFHPITFFGIVDYTDRLGFHFKCDLSDHLKAVEKDMLSWVDQHCAIYIGYKPNQTDVFPDFSTCTSNISSANNGFERCIKTRNDTPRTFAILDLEGSVDPADSFAIMFACDDSDPIKSEKIEKSIEVFMGFYLIHHPSDVDLNIGCAPPYFDPIYPYLQCPQQLNDRLESEDSSYTMLCFASKQSKNWGYATLGTNKTFVGHCDQMFVGLFPSIQR